MIGKLERLPLREVWKHEAQDFTTWLEENIEILNESLDLSLSGAEREKRAGTLNVDLIAEDDAGNPVVIENQLEKSNHDHLGKLITYMSVIGSKTAIWIGICSLSDIKRIETLTKEGAVEPLMGNFPNYN